MLQNKKGVLGLGSLTGIIMLLVVIGIMLVVALKVTTGVRDAMATGDTEAKDAARNATAGLANISEQQGLLGTIIIFGIIIGVVVMAFMVRGGM
jgi:ascorbate-specific PTS system EIIC-type component UlaA